VKQHDETLVWRETPESLEYIGVRFWHLVGDLMNHIPDLPPLLKSATRDPEGRAPDPCRHIADLPFMRKRLSERLCQGIARDVGISGVRE
jgi:hypothetical protein